ncbi:MAG: hypothetical protein ACYCYI_12490 [Saccharofermentanales bacterium]
MKTQFKIVIGLFIVIVFAFITTYLRIWKFGIVLGPYFLHHWFTIIGGTYILTATLIFSLLKRHTGINPGILLKVHVFGNILALTLIFMHIAMQLSRSGQSFPELGTGFSSFVIFIAISIFGFMTRFGILIKKRESWRLMHIGLAMSLLVIVTMHFLRNFNII